MPDAVQHWAYPYPELTEDLIETPPRLNPALDLVRGIWAMAAETSKNGEAEPKQKV
ncbi:hypothetical protein ACFXJ5_06945 [Streptomyces sp. NPDC059373]